MPWESRTVTEQRKAFCEAASTAKNFSAVCREYGISRPTGYKWMERYTGDERLEDRSKAPKRVANRTDPEIERRILELRQENKGWGCRTIRTVLQNRGFEELPCAKTINNILLRNNCIDQEESMKRHQFIRFEKDCCNDMWQTDFKGEFKMLDGHYCYPLTIIDDHSRFSIKIKPVLSTANVVLPAFKEAFREYGIPKSVLSDHGREFSGLMNGYTQFTKWLMCNDVLPVHCRVRHPQTQGKIERFHGSMKRELLKYRQMTDIDDANTALQDWRTKYNTVRPHEALGMARPADVYHPSNRIFTDKIETYEYSGDYRLIKVNSWGYVRFDRWQIYLSETMIGEYIEFRPNPDGDTFFACFRNFRIAEFSAEDGKLLNRNIRRL